MVRWTGPLLVLAVALLACGDTEKPKPATPASGAATTIASVTTPAFVRGGDPTATVAATGSAAPSADPSATGSADPVASAAASGTPGDDAPNVDPAPELKVKNIGMHIGGGPNDSETKRPIRNAVQKHYIALKRCYLKKSKTPKVATFGVDIRIPGKGGVAKISHPRNSIPGEGVTDCLVAAFEQIEFKRPPHGAPQMVSFSIRFDEP